MKKPCVPEWEPSEPEPFYQPTGQEKTPTPAGGEEKGTVVYCVDHSNFERMEPGHTTHHSIKTTESFTI